VRHLSEPFLADRLAFRGGTAIHKLLFRQRSAIRRTSISCNAGRADRPDGDALRGVLSWLGRCQRDHGDALPPPELPVHARVRADRPRQGEVEINTREHESLYGTRAYPFTVENPWFTGRSAIVSFEPEELFGTKLRALLQRRKGRDLFDLHVGFRQLALDSSRVRAAFEHYIAQDGTLISRANAEERMLGKLTRS